MMVYYLQLGTYCTLYWATSHYQLITCLIPSLVIQTFLCMILRSLPFYFFIVQAHKDVQFSSPTRQTSRKIFHHAAVCSQAGSQLLADTCFCEQFSSQVVKLTPNNIHFCIHIHTLYPSWTNRLLSFIRNPERCPTATLNRLFEFPVCRVGLL